MLQCSRERMQRACQVRCMLRLLCHAVTGAMVGSAMAGSGVPAGRWTIAQKAEPLLPEAQAAVVCIPLCQTGIKSCWVKVLT